MLQLALQVALLFRRSINHLSSLSQQNVSLYAKDIIIVALVQSWCSATRYITMLRRLAGCTRVSTLNSFLCYTVQYSTADVLQLSAPAGMGKGALAPYKCCKVFYALAVTVSRSVDQLYTLCIIFRNLAGGEIWRVGMVHLVVLACVLSATTKKGRQLFSEKNMHPRRVNPGYAYEFVNP